MNEAERLPPEMHREIELAWNDLPDALKAHPGVKRLYRACGVKGIHGNPAFSLENVAAQLEAAGIPEEKK